MRNHNMDAIRGIAVLGLLYMNMFYFGIFELGYTPLEHPPNSDKFLTIISLIFIDGRFRSLFCILFGAGLYIVFKQYTSFTLLHKRLFWLGIIGLIHGFIFWAGDILFTYALAGWLCLKYISDDDACLFMRSKIFMLIAIGVTIVLSLGEANDVIYRDSANFLAIYHPLYEDVGCQFVNNIIMYLIMLVMNPLITMWMTASLMLIGILLYKNNVFERGLTNKQLLVMGFFACIFTFLRLILNFIPHQWAIVLSEPVNWLAAVFTAVIYIHCIVRLCNNSSKRLMPIQAVGRLALSCYLLQTLAMVWLFKFYQIHWVIRFNLIDYWLVASVFALIQIGLCYFYFKHFKIGPFEWIWRKLINDF